MIAIRKLGHVVLKVRDLQRSVRFYRDILGLKEVARLSDGMVFFVADHSSHHDFAIMAAAPGASSPSDKSVGLYHVAFKIGDDIEELVRAKEWLQTNGVAILGSADHTVSKSLYLNDPDGNGIELYVDADPGIWRENPGAVASIKHLDL